MNLSPLMLTFLIYALNIITKTRYQNSLQIAPLYLVSRWRFIVFMFLKHVRVNGLGLVFGFVGAWHVYPMSLARYFSLLLFIIFALTQFAFLALSHDDHRFVLIGFSHCLWFIPDDVFVIMVGLLLIGSYCLLLNTCLQKPQFRETIQKPQSIFLVYGLTLLTYGVYKYLGIDTLIPLPHVLCFFMIVTITFLDASLQTHLDRLRRIKTHFNLYRLLFDTPHPNMLPQPLVHILNKFLIFILGGLTVMAFEGYGMLEIGVCCVTLLMALTSFLDLLLWHHLTHRSLLYYKPVIRALIQGCLTMYQSLYCVYVFAKSHLDPQVLSWFDSITPLFGSISLCFVLLHGWRMTRLFKGDRRKKKRIV